MNFALLSVALLSAKLLVQSFLYALEDLDIVPDYTVQGTQ